MIPAVLLTISWKLILKEYVKDLLAIFNIYIDGLIHPKSVTDGNRFFEAGWRHERVVVCEKKWAMNKCVEVLQVELSLHKRKEEFGFLENLFWYIDTVSFSGLL